MSIILIQVTHTFGKTKCLQYKMAQLTDKKRPLWHCTVVQNLFSCQCQNVCSKSVPRMLCFKPLSMRNICNLWLQTVKTQFRGVLAEPSDQGLPLYLNIEGIKFPMHPYNWSYSKIGGVHFENSSKNKLNILKPDRTPSWWLVREQTICIIYQCLLLSGQCQF